MKWIDVPQGAEAWINTRLGIPTSSNFERILQPKKLGPSTQQNRYLCELVAERILRQQVVDFGSMWTERGSEMEKEAVAYYELTTDTETKPCGIALTDDGRIGASPDRIAGDGLLEVKSPSAPVHIHYLIFGIEADYRLQLQGQLWVTRRPWVDFLSHCPGFPQVLHRIEAEPDVFEAFDAELPKFCAAVDYATDKLRAMMTREAA